MKRTVLVSLLVGVLLFTGFGGQIARAADAPAQPYLYFTQEELTNLRALQTAPSHQTIWNNISSWAVAHLNDAPPDEPSAGDPGYIWRGATSTIRGYLEVMGFMYAMTEDTVYADAAKDWMLSVSGWSLWDWNENHGQATRILSMGIAFGYDVLYDYLSPSERDLISQAMVTHITPMYDTRIANPDYGVNYPGTIATTAGAIGLASLALGEDYAGSSDWLNFSISEAQRVLSDYGGQDGVWPEGLSYSSYVMDEFVPFLDALKRVTGQDLFAGSEFLANHAYFYIYLTYNGRPLQFEDCNWFEGYNPNSLTFIYRLASEYDNGYAQWFADNYASQSMMQSFIWKNPDVVAMSPVSLPLTGHFDDTGYVVTRSGWGSNDLVFAFKSGSSRGHAHASQNEFHIYYEGKPITSGAGYVCMSPEDATWSHNCILVNGEGQGQEPGDYTSLPLGTTGEIEQVDVSDPYYRYVLGDATAPYDGKLSKWLRHVVFVEPNYFVIYDELAASSAKQFDWLLHLKNMGGEDYNLSVDGDVITLAKDGVKLEVKVLEPEGFASEIVHYDKPWEYDYDYIKVRPAENTSSTQFLTVLFPLAQDESALPTEKVSIGNLIGAKVTDGENLDLILFSRDGNPVDEYVELGGYYQSADDNSYAFDGTQVKAQFDTYQVMRLEELTGTNHAPVLDPINNKAVNQGQLLEFIITATDPDGDSLTYLVSNRPEGANFDPATQTFSWTPTYDQAGTYPNVHFEVTDGRLTDAEDITITVNSAEVTPPVISFIPPTDDDNAVVDRDWTEVSVSVDSTLDTSSFIDWNRSLVGYWNFNEDAGSVAIDKSTYGNNGTLKNGPQWTTGKFGPALGFDGIDDYVDCESCDLYLTNRATLEAWFYMDDWTGEMYQEICMGGFWNVFMDIHNSSQKIRAGFAVNGTTEQTPGVSITKGEWHHAVAVYDGASVKLYLDGNLASQDIDIATPNGNIDDFGSYPGLHIGKHRQGSAYYFKGSIDEVRVWNRALSPEEIRASYNSKINNLSHKFTGLADGTYQYYAYTTDTNGNSAQTETRTLTIETTPSSYPPGDANQDGSVNSLDITKLKRIIMGLDAPTPEADANGDGNVDALDITSVELIITGAW